jgi:hypothetical protein
MFALVKNDNSIKLFAPYTNWEDKNGTEYGPDELLTLTPQEKQDLGIYDVAFAPRPDDRFYKVSEEITEFNSSLKVVTVTYTSTPKELEDNGATKGLKSQWIAQIKQTANNLLSHTDWMLVRKIERNVDIPAATVTYRAAVIAEATRVEEAIAEAEAIDTFRTAVESLSWPAAE